MRMYRTREEIESMYSEQEAQAARLSTLCEIKEADLMNLNRIGKYNLIDESWHKLNKSAQNALINDAHPHIRSCALIASRATP